MDKENQPEMAERKHAGDPRRFLARPISLASYPVATGRPLPGPRARVRVIEGVNAGGLTRGINELLRSCGQPPLHRPGGPIRSSSVAPPKPINLNSPHQILRHPRANLDKENQPRSAERRQGKYTRS